MNNPEKLIYLAAPYSHPEEAVREWRYRQINQVAAGLLTAGLAVFSPLSHSHPIAMDGALPTDFDFWQRLNRLWLDRCDELWVVQLEGWEKSVGVAGEIAHAKATGKPVRYFSANAVDNLRKGP